MTKNLKIVILILALVACNSSIDTPELISEQLPGRWELTGVYKNGIQITGGQLS